MKFKTSIILGLSLICGLKAHSSEITEKKLNCETLGDAPGHIATSMLIRNQQNSTGSVIKEAFFYVTPQYFNAETEEIKLSLINQNTYSAFFHLDLQYSEPAVVLLNKNTFSATIFHRDEALFMCYLFSVIE